MLLSGNKNKQTRIIHARKLSFDLSKLNPSNFDASKLNPIDMSKINLEANKLTNKLMDDSIEQLVETTKKIEKKLIDMGLNDTEITVGINIGIVSVSLNKRIKNDNNNIE